MTTPIIYLPIIYFMEAWPGIPPGGPETGVPRCLSPGFRRSSQKLCEHPRFEHHRRLVPRQTMPGLQQKRCTPRYTHIVRPCRPARRSRTRCDRFRTWSGWRLRCPLVRCGADQMSFGANCPVAFISGYSTLTNIFISGVPVSLCGGLWMGRSPRIRGPAPPWRENPQRWGKVGPGAGVGTCPGGASMNGGGPT